MQSTTSSSYLSLRTKLKAVQDKYRKSSMSDKIRSKFTKTGRSSTGKLATADHPGSLEGMSKFLSYSHGALADLDEFPPRQQPQQPQQQQLQAQQAKRRSESASKEQLSTSDVTTVVALIEPPPHSVSSQSSKSSNFSQPSTPRTRPDFDEIDSGILNEIEEAGSADSMSRDRFYETYLLRANCYP
jgi:hypothetical protein